jgi:DNA mismatch repair protein MutL
VTQGLLFPELLTLPPSEAKILESMIDEIRYLGFDVASIGGGSFSINGLPANIEGLSPQALLRDMVVSVCEGGSPVLADQKHRIALSLAKATAIVDGQFLSQEEMDVLMSDLLRSSNPNITPDGKTIIAMLAQEKIDKMFA